MKAREIHQELPEIEGVPLQKVKKVIEIFENRMNEEDVEDAIVPFEYLIGSLYPKIYHNIMETINKKYGEGYIQGRQDMKNEIESNN